MNTEKFIKTVREMRAAQKGYFAKSKQARNTHLTQHFDEAKDLLSQSKQLEREIDAMLEEGGKG